VFNADDPNNGDSVEEEEQDEDSYENRLARLHKKHGKTIADFKLKCWAKMLVNLDNAITFLFLIKFFYIKVHDTLLIDKTERIVTLKQNCSF